jgi:hypothetical protein
MDGFFIPHVNRFVAPKMYSMDRLFLDLLYVHKSVCSVCPGVTDLKEIFEFFVVFGLEGILCCMSWM